VGAIGEPDTRGGAGLCGVWKGLDQGHRPQIPSRGVEPCAVWVTGVQALPTDITGPGAQAPQGTHFPYWALQFSPSWIPSRAMHTHLPGHTCEPRSH
jgi:hypothetical protein